jgi:hypothetical protein
MARRGRSWLTSASGLQAGAVDWRGCGAALDWSLESEKMKTKRERERGRKEADDRPFSLMVSANIQLGWANLWAHSQYSLGLRCTMLVIIWVFVMLLHPFEAISLFFFFF